MDSVRQAFRRYFIDELRVDPGWSEYIDLLVSALDVRAIHYLQSAGVPFEFLFSAFGSLFESSNSFVQVYHHKDGEDDKNAYTLLGFNMPFGATTYYDFGEARVTSMLQDVKDASGVLTSWATCSLWVVPDTVTLEVLLAAGDSWASFVAENAVWDSSVDLFKYDVSTPCCFFVRVWDYLHDSSDSLISPETKKDPSCVGLQLVGVPDGVNASFVSGARQSSGVGNSLYGVSPYAVSLFRRLFGLGIDYTLCPFRVYLVAGSNLGSTTVEWDSWVEFRQVLDALNSFAPLSGSGYSELVGLVAAEDSLVSAVHDLWGTGDNVVSSNSPSASLRAIFAKYGSIVGYDKKLWVVGNNSPGSKLIYLAGYPDSSSEWGSSARYVWASPSETTISEEASTSSAPGGSFKVGYGGGSSAGSGWSAKLTSDYSVPPQIYHSSELLPYAGFEGIVFGTPVSDADPVSIPLVTPDSATSASSISYGITKDYYDLSLNAGSIDRIILSFGCSQAQFYSMLLASGLASSESECDGFIRRLEDILSASVPIGVRVQIEFNYRPSRVELSFAVNTPDLSPFVLFDDGGSGVSTKTISVGAVAGSTTVDILSNSEWVVSGSGVGPFARVSVDGKVFLPTIHIDVPIEGSQDLNFMTSDNELLVTSDGDNFIVREGGDSTVVYIQSNEGFTLMKEDS